MAFYYVKNGGTATGDSGRFGTQQAGSFALLGAANYYNDISAALAATTPPALGDFINPSDLHSYQYATGQVFSGDFVIQAVDDSNIDASRTPGNMAIETMSGSSPDFSISCVMSGLSLTPGDGIIINGMASISDCSFSVKANGDSTLVMTSDGRTVNAINCTFNLDATGAVLVQPRGGSSLYMSGGEVKTTTTGVTNLSSGNFTSGGGVIEISSADLSAITGTLIANVGLDVVNDDLIDVKFDMCKLSSGVAFTNETFKSYNQRALFTRCSDSSAAAEYQYHLHAFGGDVNDDSAIYRNEDEAYPISGQKISLEAITNSDASEALPFWFDLATEGIELSDGAKQELTVSLTSDTALDNKQVYIQLLLADGTSYGDTNSFITCPATVGGTFDFLATATTLTTDVTSTWTGGLTNNYEISVDTSSLPCADQAVTVRVFVTEPSVTINFSEQLRIS